MVTAYVKCTFETGIVLLASSHTEGRNDVLDFVPGSKFVGIAAGFVEQIVGLDFNTIHDGSLCFGEATLLKEGKMTYKIPLSYFKPKVIKKGDEEVFNHHKTSNQDHRDYQLQQIRSGYMTIDGKTYEPKYNFRQKSTYGSDKNMYGYDAANHSQEWVFTISAKDGKLLDEIISELTKKTYRIGKSKRVEYGKVSFKYLKDMRDDMVTFDDENLSLLYVKSRLALYDPETGQPSFEPTLKNLGLDVEEEVEIDWNNTQIRTTTFLPYNTAQKSKVYERIVIEKGSVIAIKGLASNSLREKLDYRVGAYQNEGYGEIVVNPIFLETKHPYLQEGELPNTIKEAESLDNYTPQDLFIDALVASKRDREAAVLLVDQVNAFIKEHSTKFKDMNAQWGTVRSIVMAVENTEVMKRVEAYMTHGAAKGKWEKKKELIFGYISENEITNVSGFLRQTAQQIQKRNSQRGVA